MKLRHIVFPFVVCVVCVVCVDRQCLALLDISVRHAACTLPGAPGRIPVSSFSYCAVIAPAGGHFFWETHYLIFFFTSFFLAGSCRGTVRTNPSCTRARQGAPLNGLPVLEELTTTSAARNLWAFRRPTDPFDRGLLWNWFDISVEQSSYSFRFCLSFRFYADPLRRPVSSYACLKKL